MAQAAGYDAAAKALRPSADPVAAPKEVNFEKLVVSGSNTLTPEMGLSGLQRQQLEAGIRFISSADEAFEFTDEGQFLVEQVVCPSTGQRFERFTYYAGDTFCGFVVELGSANVRALIEDGDVVPT